MVIGHIGLIQKLKKDFVLDVIYELDKQGHDVLGIFPGEVREQGYFEELKSKASDLRISDKVVFLGRRDDIPDLLQIIDVLIIPSFEGFPLSGL